MYTVLCGQVMQPYNHVRYGMQKTYDLLSNGAPHPLWKNWNAIRSCLMKFEAIQRRLTDLEDTFGERAFSVVLERAVFRKGEGRVLGRILIQPGCEYHAI